MAARGGLCAVLGVALVTLLSGTTACGEDSPLRLPVDTGIHAAIDLALQRSAIFRQLVHVVEQSDSLVYLVRGDCGYARHACLTRVTTAAQFRVMVVMVDSGIAGPDGELAGAIGHELQHVAEVISYPSVRSSEAMFALYQRIGFHVRRI